jgi:diphthamide synthase (EF-2-diphthine--ammonia ligase)
MEGGIRDVQDASQLKKWIEQMFHRGHEIILLLDITPNTTTSFMYQYQKLSVKDVVDTITDKIESMNVTYRMVNIEQLKRDFVFDEPESELHVAGPDVENASLAQLLVVLQKLNESI